ncbi:hypothetical protein R3P38DRAFT_3329511 [Favolaschia claudopus]|uniref:PARP catalytic domain-containing protein n=1 Tax=Favolaschia claudopus TaxID=2862362 RepID=A0AAV9ZZ35_9AGAR
MPSLLHWGSRHKTQTPVQDDMCEQCGEKPKFIEPGGSRHAYCSRSCAKEAQGASPSACALRGMQAVRLGQATGCDACNDHPRSANSDLCIACDRKTSGPRLKEISAGSTAFVDVRSQFLSEWDSLDAARPHIDKVYQVIAPRNIRARYNAYRAAQRAMEEIRAFHSAQCICDMGTKTPLLCNFKSCGICCIVKSSFNEFAFGEKYNTGRFGEGIYSYRNPSLADAFATSATSTPYRVLIACDVAVPSDFEVRDEESLFVPCADAIVPAFIIMYTV